MGDFNIRNGVLYKYSGSGGNVVIPAEVTSIGDRAFVGCSNLTGVEILSGMTSIGDAAFAGCSGLTSVTIPDGVTSIGDSAFYGCNGLTSVTIPESVTHVGYHAFEGCKSLKNVEILMRYFHVVSGILIKYSGSGGDVEIPSEVIIIGDRAFDRCGDLTNVTIPDSVTSIGDDSFRYCSGLTSVAIPDGVTSIGRGAFVGCSGLTNVTIPDSVTSIGDFVFEGCSSLSSVEIPSGVKSIGESAFSGCNGLMSVTIPGSVTSIGHGAFKGCSGLTSVTIPDSATSIGYYTFEGCSGLTSVTIPDSVTSIGGGAFKGCSGLTSVTVPDSVTSIGGDTFKGCSGLTSVTIPDSVTSIGDSAFSDCKNLKEVYFKKKYPKLGNKIFEPHKPDFPLEDLQTTNSIPVVLINNFNSFTEKERPYLILFQTAKGWKQWVREDVTEKNADDIVKNITALIQELPKLQKKAGQQAAEFALEYQAYIQSETLRSLVNVLKEKKCTEAIKSMQEDLTMKVKLKEGKAGTKQTEPLNPTEKIVQEHWIYDDTTNKVCSIIQNQLRSGSVLPHYIGLEQLASREVLAFVIAAYARQAIGVSIYYSDYKKGYLPFAVDRMADQVAAALNGEELLTFLEKGIYKQRFDQTAFIFIPAFARYVDESRTEKLISKMKEWENWNTYARKGRESIMIVRGALMLNDSRSAMLHMEKVGQLDAYAKLRGTDAETLRDTVLADFGLNEDGRKFYDLGNKTVRAFVGHDLKVQLYDEATEKEVRSLPKRGADLDKYSAASKDLAELKKNVKKVVKARNDQLFGDFLSGKTVSAAKWKRAYLENPVLYRVAELLVWSQGTASFTLNQDGPVKSDGTGYEITEEEIRVAHPVEMDPQSVKAWQQYFTSHDLRQPFEQVWEPVIDPETIHPDRYSGQRVSVFRFRNQVKHGIYFFDEGFHDDIYFSCSGCDLEGMRTKETAWRHDIGPDETFTLGKFSFKEYTRQVNHIVSLMDRWTVTGRMLKDDVSVKDQLDGFTAAQIMEFIRLTSENNCPNCAAMLLQYKQENYPDFDPMTEFTLE